MPTSPIHLRLLTTVSLIAFLGGCQTHKINAIKIEPVLAILADGAEVEIGTIYSGYPSPPPRFPVDRFGVVSISEGHWLNSGSYIVVRVGGNAAYFTSDQFLFKKPHTLVLRLSLEQMLKLNEHAVLPVSSLETWDYGIESQDLRFHLSGEDSSAR